MGIESNKERGGDKDAKPKESPTREQGDLSGLEKTKEQDPHEDYPSRPQGALPEVQHDVENENDTEETTENTEDRGILVEAVAVEEVRVEASGEEGAAAETRLEEARHREMEADAKAKESDTGDGARESKDITHDWQRARARFLYPGALLLAHAALAFSHTDATPLITAELVLGGAGVSVLRNVSDKITARRNKRIDAAEQEGRRNAEDDYTIAERKREASREHYEIEVLEQEHIYYAVSGGAAQFMPGVVPETFSGDDFLPTLLQFGTEEVQSATIEKTSEWVIEEEEE